MKSIYLIRHCAATGQESEAELTQEGKQQAQALAEFLSQEDIERVISSPFTRAIESINPLVEQTQIELTLDMRLTERILSKTPIEDWLEKLETSFTDMDQTVGGGESSHAAQARVVEVLEDALESGEERLAIVTHGNLLSLLLHYVDPRYGFNEWRKLTNPDVYLLTADEDQHLSVTRLWKS